MFFCIYVHYVLGLLIGIDSLCAQVTKIIVQNATFFVMC